MCCCGHSNKPSRFTKHWEFLIWLKNYQLFFLCQPVNLCLRTQPRRDLYQSHGRTGRSVKVILLSVIVSLLELYVGCRCRISCASTGTLCALLNTVKLWEACQWTVSLLHCSGHRNTHYQNPCLASCSWYVYLHYTFIPAQAWEMINPQK